MIVKMFDFFKYKTNFQLFIQIVSFIVLLLLPYKTTEVFPQTENYGCVI